MIRSLRGRLFIGLTATIVLTGAIGAIFTYEWAFDEAIEIQDSALIQIASLAQSGSFSVNPPVREIEENAQVQLIELGKTAGAAPDQHQLFELKDGLHAATLGGRAIRVLVGTRPDGSRYAAAQPTSVRDDTAEDLAARALLPIVALIPCLLIVTGLVITRSLRPLIQLAGNLDARRADDLHPMPATDAPTELCPFITSINGLLTRIRLLLDQQRRFIADAAHELRTPITALSLQAENLDAVELPEGARSRAAALRQGMHRTKHLLDQLLALARYEANPIASEMPQVSLDQTAKEVAADLLSPAADRGIDLGFEIVEPVMVRGEPAILAILIRNLLDNALRHTPDGGRIDIGVYREDDWAVLQIEDSGLGIPVADLERIFEPFYRGSRPQGEGAGLGLSIVKRTAERLGGEVSLDNMMGHDRSGVRAIVRLPLSTALDQPSTGKQPAPSPDACFRSTS
jgi:two-component system, OmpR family, sensor kinase